jgi:hypothetical protein
MHTQTPGFTTFKDKILIFICFSNCDPRTAVCWFLIWLICDSIFLEFICFYVLKYFKKIKKFIFSYFNFLYIFHAVLISKINLKNKLIYFQAKNTLKINYNHNNKHK